MTRDRSFLAQGDFVYRGTNVPVLMRGEGATLVDADGRRYLDGEAANGAAILGYDNALLPSAMAKLDGLPLAPSFCESAVRLRVAERIAGIVERAVGVRGRVAFDLGGAQGMELAVKIARSSRPRGRFVVFEGGYHGRSLFTAHLSVSQRYRRSSPVSTAVERLPLPDCERCRFARVPTSCDAECAGYVTRRLGDELGGLRDGDDADVCALIFESMLNVAGMAAPDPRYLMAAVSEVRKLGGLIIADEVFTGMHRTGPLFGFQHYDVVPDIIVFSKGLTNGIAPLSCVWAREPLAAPQVFLPGTHSATYINAPLGLAIADAVLDRLDALDAETTVARLAGWLGEGCESLRASPEVASASVRGATARIRFRAPLAARVRAEALRTGDGKSYDGLLVASTGLTSDVIALHPPFTVTYAEVASIFAMLRAAMETAAR